MKKSLLILIIAISLYGCKKGNTPKPIAITPTPFIIGTWQRSAMNDTIYSGTTVDSIQYQKVFIPRILVFEKESPGFNGFALEGNITINISYSGSDPAINVIIQDSPVTTWRLIKVSDTKIRLIRHIGNLSYSHTGYDDEYTKQ
jgi:hypothetical protein